MYFSYNVILYVIISLIISINSDMVPIKCRDPATGGTPPLHINDRKFLIMGPDYVSFEGLGNILIFFPAAYHFASLTGREILIPDKSILGMFCRIIRCGFPTVEELSTAYPDIITYFAIKDAHVMRAHHFNLHMEGSEIIDHQLVRAWGNTGKSDWWVYYNESTACIRDITGCDRGDVPCADRHAYQQLIKGPLLHDHHIRRYKEKLIGIQDNLKLAMLSLPHSYAQRIDVALHFRNQFNFFENKTFTHIHDDAYQDEISSWLSSSDTMQLFDACLERIMMINKEQLGYNDSITNWTRTDPFYVYIAADNQQVKDHIYDKLSSFQNDSRYLIHPIMINSSHIIHTKHLNSMLETTNGEGLADLALDWYMLTLSNTILGWRRGFTPGTSTFLMSAHRMSGTKTRTNVFLPLGEGGVGTKAYQYIRHKRGYHYWAGLWMYDFLEDYRIP